MGAQQETSSGASSKPKQTSGYSGKFLVRMPSELHEQLAHAAQREDVSLNKFVTEVLATSVSTGSASDHEPASAEPASGSREPDREHDREPDREHDWEDHHDPAPSASPRLSPSAVRVALATNLVVVVVAGLVAVILLVLALQRGI